MQNKCEVCNEWHGSCASFTDDVLGRAEHYVCPNCLMWSSDPMAVKARLAVKSKKAVKARLAVKSKKAVKNGNKQK